MKREGSSRTEPQPACAAPERVGPRQPPAPGGKNRNSRRSKRSWSDDGDRW